jgi:hypothetical protein
MGGDFSRVVKGGNPVSQDGSGSIGISTDSSRFQSRALFAGLEQGEGPPRLWFAVLAQAFRDYYGDIPSEGPSRYRQVQVNYCRRNARAWFLSDSTAMGSFCWIAELFDLDARAVRRRLFSGARIALSEAPEESAPPAESVVAESVAAASVVAESAETVVGETFATETFTDESTESIASAAMAPTPPLDVMVAA